MRLKELVFIFFVSLICLFSFQTLAVSSSIRFEHLTTKDGSPQNTVNVINQYKQDIM
jgi:hypothetical protein